MYCGWWHCIIFTNLSMHVFRLDSFIYIYIAPDTCMIWFWRCHFSWLFQNSKSYRCYIFFKFAYDFTCPFWDKLLSIYNKLLNKLLISCIKNMDETYSIVLANTSIGILAWSILQYSKSIPISLPIVVLEKSSPLGSVGN